MATLDVGQGSDLVTNELDEYDDGRPIFKKHHYDKIPVDNARGAIRILKVYPGLPGQDDVLCELIPGTILGLEECQKHNPAPEFKPYDALSWCWGKGPQDGKISIRMGETSYIKRVQPNLVAALRALRHKTHDRHLWVDAICINQDHESEKNHQVEMMGEIYGKADCVRIWLGDADASSDDAILFIKQHVLQLDHFDDLCRSNEFSDKWKALLELMQREWFSRRWVVQEVALAPKAIIHCGTAKLSWTKFAVAVELFVEVETATHRLSEVMKTHTKYHHVPQWFEYISQLGASLLVDATGKLFRDYDYLRSIQLQSTQSKSEKNVTTQDTLEPLSYESEDDEIVAPEVRVLRFRQEEKQSQEQKHQKEFQTKAQPLLTLEYLVSSLSIFDVTTPHDSIYALLGIAKDTTPTAANKKLHVADHTSAVLEKFTAKKQYKVDYQAEYIDICKEFIEFCINRNAIRDPSRALDVLCRPFALDLEPRPDKFSLPSWVPRLNKASYGMDRGPGIDGLRMGRKNADSLVGLPNLTHRNYNAAETKSMDKKVFRFRKRTFDVANSDDDAKQTSKNKSTSPPDDLKKHDQEGQGRDAPEDVPGAMGHTNGVAAQTNSSNKPKIVEQASGRQAQGIKQRAENLTLLTRNGNSSTGQTTAMKTSPSHPLLPKHFSLYVSGFVLDTIAAVQPSSQNGSIPTAWAHFAGWGEMKNTPPEHFWKTLVADRGSDGKNPPVYYSRACQESFRKGNKTSGVVDTSGLIEHERNSVVAQFCRRVQAAIWNRALVRTEAGRLGLVPQNVKEHDLVCILYGCSVPVILRRFGPKPEWVIRSEMRWELKYLADHVGASYKIHLQRRRQFREKRDDDKKKFLEWEAAQREKWRKDAEWTALWKLVRAALMRIHEFRAWSLKKKERVLKRNASTDAAKEVSETMRDFLYFALERPGIYRIANWALVSDLKADPTVIELLCQASKRKQCPEDLRMTEEQSSLWDDFEQDEEWKEYRNKKREIYRKENVFRAWARRHNMPIAYRGDKNDSLKEWKKNHAQDWADEWSAENSLYLCVDSFRAWLREKGKFYGTEDFVENKQKWESDQSWHRERPKYEDEVDSFKAWMIEQGLKNPEASISKEKMQRDRIEEWRRAWIEEHPDAPWLQLHEAEARKYQELGAEIERERREENERMKKEAEKREKERFIERWRNGWRPEVVNWAEFELSFTYAQRWLKLVRKAKSHHLAEQKKRWAGPDAIACRQRERAKAMPETQRLGMKYPPWASEQCAIELKLDEVTEDSQCPTRAGAQAKPNGSDPSDTAHFSSYALPFTNHEVSRVNTGSSSAGPIDIEAQVRPESRDDGASSTSQPQSLVHQTLRGTEQSYDDVEALKSSNQHDMEPGQTRPVRSMTEGSITRLTNNAEAFHNEIMQKGKFKSKRDLERLMQRKRNELTSIYASTKAAIEVQLALWHPHQRRLVGEDGEWKYDFRPLSKAEKEYWKNQRVFHQREEAEEAEVPRNPSVHTQNGGELEHDQDHDQETRSDTLHDVSKPTVKRRDYAYLGRRLRLTKKQKEEYNRKIEANFMKKLGKNGQWYYEMMGECYIHGMMDGEAMAYQNNQGISITEFEIR